MFSPIEHQAWAVHGRPVFEQRLELRRAVELDPNLAEAETELDEIHTIRLPRMGD